MNATALTLPSAVSVCAVMSPDTLMLAAVRPAAVDKPRVPATNPCALIDAVAVICWTETLPAVETEPTTIGPAVDSPVEPATTDVALRTPAAVRCCVVRTPVPCMSATVNTPAVEIPEVPTTTPAALTVPVAVNADEESAPLVVKLVAVKAAPELRPENTVNVPI